MLLIAVFIGIVLLYCPVVCYWLFDLMGGSNPLWAEDFFSCTYLLFVIMISVIINIIIFVAKIASKVIFSSSTSRRDPIINHTVSHPTSFMSLLIPTSTFLLVYPSSLYLQTCYSFLKYIFQFLSVTLS